MIIQHTTAKRDEECAYCAYPFDTGDKAYMVKSDDESVYCGTNCATKDVSRRVHLGRVEAYRGARKDGGT